MIHRIDRVFLNELGIGNLNNIHEAAHRGDVRWLEAAIAIGAAIDHPVLPNVPEGPHPPTPKNCTALLDNVSDGNKRLCFRRSPLAPCLCKPLVKCLLTVVAGCHLILNILMMPLEIMWNG